MGSTTLRSGNGELSTADYTMRQLFLINQVVESPSATCLFCWLIINSSLMEKLLCTLTYVTLTLEIHNQFLHRLKDLVVRTETNKLVTDLVNLDRVRSLLKTISCRRQFLAYRERLHQQGIFSVYFRSVWPLIFSKEIPSIVVDGLPDGSPASPSPSVNNSYITPVYGARPGSPTPDRRFSSTPDVSLALDNVPKLQRGGRRTSDISMLSTDLGYECVCVPVIGHWADISVTDGLQ
jgi:hypothetical protein